MSNKNYQHTGHPPKHHWRRSLNYGLTKIAKVSALGVLLHSAVWAGNIGANSLPLTPRSLQPTGTFYLEGVEFNDLNGNGVQDADEKGIAFKDIKITNDDDLVAKTATTDIQGRYSIKLVLGNYTVRLTELGKSWQTAPSKAKKAGAVVPYKFSAQNGTVTKEINFGIWDGQDH